MKTPHLSAYTGQSLPQGSAKISDRHAAPALIAGSQPSHEFYDLAVRITRAYERASTAEARNRVRPLMRKFGEATQVLSGPSDEWGPHPDWPELLPEYPSSHSYARALLATVALQMAAIDDERNVSERLSDIDLIATARAKAQGRIEAPRLAAERREDRKAGFIAYGYFIVMVLATVAEPILGGLMAVLLLGWFVGASMRKRP
jgi:hypothetical protein